MPWTYRIVQKKAPAYDNQVQYGIHEAYFRGEGSPIDSWTEKPIEVSCWVDSDSDVDRAIALENLKWQLEAMLAAIDKEIVIDDFK